MNTKFQHACEVVLAEIDRIFPSKHRSYILKDEKPLGEHVYLRRHFVANEYTDDKTLRTETTRMFPDGVHPKRFRRNINVPHFIDSSSGMRASKSGAWVRCLCDFNIVRNKNIYRFDVEYTA